MPDRFALVIGLDSPGAPQAESDALAFARALGALGFAGDALTTLTGGQATRTAIESRLRKLAKAPPVDLLVIFHAGPGFVEDGAAHLACHDTQPDDRAETGLPLRALLDAARSAAPCRRLAVFLDVRGEGFPLDDVEAFFAARPGGVCFASHAEGEASHVSGSLKSGVWAHHVVEAFSGRAPRALEGELLTASSLQAYLEQELPRSLRATFREAPPQTPLAFTHTAGGRVVLADVSGVLGEEQPVSDPRLQPLKRGALRSETTGKVKSLTGFRK